MYDVLEYSKENGELDDYIKNLSEENAMLKKQVIDLEANLSSACEERDELKNILRDFKLSTAYNYVEKYVFSNNSNSYICRIKEIARQKDLLNDFTREFFDKHDEFEKFKKSVKTGIPPVEFQFSLDISIITLILLRMLCEKIDSLLTYNEKEEYGIIEIRVFIKRLSNLSCNFINNYYVKQSFKYKFI